MNPAIIERPAPAASRFLRRFVLSLRASCALMSAFILLAFAGQAYAQITWTERTGTVQEGDVFPYGVGETIPARFELPNPSDATATQMLWMNGCEFGEGDSIEIRAFDDTDTACTYAMNTVVGATFGVFSNWAIEGAYTDGTNASLETNASNGVGAGTPGSVKAVAFSFVAVKSGTTIVRNFTFSFFTPMTFTAAYAHQSLAVGDSSIAATLGLAPINGYRGVAQNNALTGLTYNIDVLDTNDTALAGIRVLQAASNLLLFADTPTEPVESTSYVITAGDQDNNFAYATFTIGVSAPLAFTPPSQDVVYVVNSAASYQIGSTEYAAPLTLSAASGGDGTDHVYTEITALTAAGLTGARQANGEVFISGTPTTVGVTTYAYSVSNAGGTALTDPTFRLIINVVPDELTLTQEDLALTAGHVFTHTLNAELGGNGTPAFTLTDINGNATLPTGLAFAASSRKLTASISLRGNAAGSYIYSVTRGSESTSTTFEITVNDAVSFAAQPTLSYAEGAGGSATLLTASGGTGTKAYALTRDHTTSTLPAAIGFAMSSRMLTVQSSVAVANGGDYILTATDDNGASATVTFAINISGALAFNAAQGNLTFTTANAGGHTLESATGGVGALVYKATLPGETTLPAGYSFNPTTLELRSDGATSGTASIEYTVTDEDATPDSEVVTFMVAHVAAPTIAGNFAASYPFRANSATGKAYQFPRTNNGTEPLTHKLTLGTDYFDTEFSILNGVTFYPNSTPATINGTALAAATYAFTYHVRDAHGVTASSSILSFIADDALAAPDNPDVFVLVGFIGYVDVPRTVNGLGTVTAAIDSWTGGAPSGISFDATRHALHVYTEQTTVMDYTAVVSAKDSFNTPADDSTWNLTVRVVERPIFSTLPASITAATYTVGALSFTSADVDGSTGVRYVNTFTINAAIGGVPPITRHYTEGDLAASGMNIAVQSDESVIITGSPTRAGDYTYTRIAVDSNTPPREGTYRLTVHVDAAPQFGGGQDDFLFTPGQTGIAATPLVAASDGFGTLAYSISPTTFAAGVIYKDNVSPPTIEGAPSNATDEGVRYTLTATDGNGAQASTRFEIGIAGALTFEVEQDLVFTVGETLSLLSMVDGGVEPYTNDLTGATVRGFTDADNTFDNGLAFNAADSTISGVLNITAVNQLTYSGLTYKVTDDNGVFVNEEFSFTVQPITFFQLERELLVTRGSNNTFSLIDAQHFRSADGGTVGYTVTAPERTYEGLSFVAGIGAFVTTTDFDENILPSQKITYIISAVYQYPGGTGGAPAVQTVVITAFNPEELLPINEVVLSEVASASVAGTLGAITDRLAEANILAPYFSIGGQSPLMALATNAKAWADGELDEKEVLNNSQLILPLGIGGGQTIWSQIALWASAHYRNMHGDNDAIDWKGSVSGGHIGFDVAASENMLFGLAFSRTKADMEYRILENDVEGGHIMTLRSVYPYLNWRIGESNLWASVGDGEGEITISQDGEEFESDVGLIAVGLGVSNDVSPQVQLRLEMRGGELDIEGNEASTVLAQDISTNTARAMIKWHDSALRSDMRSAFVEIGVRNDGGDGDTGASMETAMGYKQHSHLATTIEFVIHGLVGREDYNEWGAFGQFRMAAGFDGQGLALRMRPSYGEAQGEFGRVWDDELVDKLTGDDDADAYQWRNESRLSYGIQSARGLIAPFGEIISAGDDIYRLGVDWSPRNLWTRQIDLNLSGEHHRNQAGANERRVLLQGEVKF